MEEIKILQPFIVQDKESGSEYTFKRGKKYVVNYSSDSEVCVFIDDADDEFDGNIEIPADWEGDGFEFFLADAPDLVWNRPLITRKIIHDTPKDHSALNQILSSYLVQ